VPEWAQEFDAWSKAKLEAGDHHALVNYESLGVTAKMAVPTNDHYLPMLYTLGALGGNEGVRFTHESFQNGSISMRCFESAA
jgi:4,5-DOPA dioxygenase extradiol